MHDHFGGLRPTLGLAIAITSALPPVVSAQTPQQPLLTPTRDVTVTYRLTGGTSGKVAEKMTTTFTQQGERARIDYFHWMESKTPYTSVVFDRPANRSITIIQERRSYLERDTTGLSSPALLLSKDMQFTRLGSAVVANTACTDWSIKADGTSNGRQACITEDGVLLRLMTQPPKDQALTAIELKYGSPPDSIFEVPADFTQLKARAPAQR